MRDSGFTLLGRTKRMNGTLLTVLALMVVSLILTTISYSSVFLYNQTNLDATSTVDFTTEEHVQVFSTADRDDVGSGTANELGEDKTSLSSHTELPPNVPTTNVAISHIFSPYVWNDEFRVVSRSWRIAAEKARQRGINVELICAVLPEDSKVIPRWARPVLLTKRVENYRPKASALPSYGEMFTVLHDKAYGEFVMYSNADIAVVPDFYIKVFEMMNQDLRKREFQEEILLRTRETFFSKCKAMNVKIPGGKSELMCGRDAIAFFENLGGRPPTFMSGLMRFFRNASVTAEEAIETAYDPALPDSRTDGNAMTITRRQFPKAEPSKVLRELFTADGLDMNADVLRRMYEKEGEPHPGNDVFIMPRRAIPRLLMDTPFIHLRPSGFLIGQHLKDQPNLVWRRIVSAPGTMLTFHVGKGTDEWPVRAELQPRAVLFEVAHYFTRKNATTESFWPPSWCEDAGNYREYGTGSFCGETPGDYCRGYVRLACTKYWHQGSRDRHALNTICYRVSSKGRTLESPFCEFCNELVGGESYRCTKKLAKECQTFPCS